jgi:Flp pilus assembly protein TadD
MNDVVVLSDDPDTLYVRGLLHLRAGAHARAIEALTAALALRPHHAGTRRNLLRALLGSGQSEAALQQADIALLADPDTAELHYIRGTALNALGDPAGAAEALRRAVTLDPGHAASWLNLGNACADLDDLDAAERHCRTAIALDPLLAEAHASLGYLLAARGALPASIAACEAAIRLRPGFVQAHWNLATAALLAGELPRGFREYEWRKRHDRFRRDFVNLPGSIWDGSDPTGRTILVKSEQGYGDTIQFSRFLPMITALGGTPILACEPPLLSLFAGQPDMRAVVKAGPMPHYDAWIDQMSLPVVFGTTIATIPAASRYLFADAVRVKAWRSRLPPGRIVGLAWSGNRLHSNDRRRSMPAAALAPLAALPNLTCVSLQPGQTMPNVRDLTPWLTDFAETAALIACLDLVVTVDTAVAHLAGALGVPTWIMVPHAPDWRWLTERDDSPWYPSVRLFRQSVPGDWPGVVERVAISIQATASCRRCPRTGEPRTEIASSPRA